MLERLKLIEGYATQSWRYWSNRALILLTALATYAALNPQETAKLIAYVPETYRPLLTLGAGFVLWWVRGSQQKKV